MQVFQTDVDPPSKGRIVFAIIGSTANKSAALRKSVPAKSQGKDMRGNISGL
jgi:hypothetical protein